MKKITGFYALIMAFVFYSCTYNLPADNGAKDLETTVAKAQSPKNLKALKNALTASDNNRAMEYVALRNQLDSNTQLINIRMASMQDSMARVNRMLVGNSQQIQKQLSDMQLLLYILLGMVFGLMLYVFYRLPARKEVKAVKSISEK